MLKSTSDDCISDPNSEVEVTSFLKKLASSLETKVPSTKIRRFPDITIKFLGQLKKLNSKNFILSGRVKVGDKLQLIPEIAEMIKTATATPINSKYEVLQVH